MAKQAHDILSYCRHREDEFVELLRKVVETESPSLDKATTDKLVDLIETELKASGCDVQRLSQDNYGDHLLATYWPADAGPQPDGQVLVLCHIDTVWPAGEVERRPFSVEDGKAYGPGAMDMKGGVVQALMSLRIMNALGIRPARPVKLMFNTDEEVGSPTSRATIEAEARQSKAAFVLEPAVGLDGAIKTFRKGVGMFRVKVTGKAAHAGADHRNGVNAIEELARQIMDIQALTDYESGTTLNVGLVSGGSRSNVVPALAEASVDCRVSSMVEAKRITVTMKALVPKNPAATVEVEGGLNRPPMERTPAIVEMYERAKEAAAELGLELAETGTGGGSDGNFTAAVGCPTLDGMGAVGEGGHAAVEYAVIKFMPERTALLIKMLERT